MCISLAYTYMCLNYMCMILPYAIYSIFIINLSITNYRGYKIADQDDLKVPLITNSGNKVI